MNDKNKIQEVTFSSNDYISMNHCDQLSRLNGLDLKELLYQIKNYSLRLKPTLGLADDITFGIEIEFEDAYFDEIEEALSNIGQTNNYDWKEWNIETDDSVKTTKNNRICGGEIVTPILIDEEIVWKKLKIICDMLEKNRAIVNHKAGGHIHIGSQILGSDVNTWFNMLKLWIIYEKIIYRFSYGEKLGARNNILTYANPMSDILYMKRTQILLEKDLTMVLKRLLDNCGKGINFNKAISGIFENNNTIEVRCPNGTLNPIVWQNNINFFTKLFLYCKNNNFNFELINNKLNNYEVEDDPHKTYQHIFLKEAIELSDLIFDNNLDKVCFLKQYVKDFKRSSPNAKKLAKIKL